MARRPEAGITPTRSGESAEDARPAERGATVPVVGVGASAGGLEAFRALVEMLPADSGIAWVLIQHMAPDLESHLPHILRRHTGLPVTQVTGATPVEPDKVYVIAPGHTMTIRGSTFGSVADGDPLARRSSIDGFLLSLAEDRGDRCGCALLSGAGTDGTLGLKAVKEAGGLTVTQSLGSAAYDSMLRSAVRTGLVDRELEPEDMATAFVDFLVHGRRTEAEVGDGQRRQICRVLRAATGHDFSGYKSSTVDRRIRRRMHMLDAAGVPEYLEWLRDDPHEPQLLFRDLLIGVTQFFRDAEAFDAVVRTALPAILDSKTADDEVRIWAAGCSTGEEVYSLAMLLREQASDLDSVPELRVFGSDIDENALYVARTGRYPRSIEADVSPERLERFFEKEDGTYVVRNELREMCLFAQHNILRDPPFSRIDLLACRNLLIYMESDLQKRLLPVLHYALRPGGFLFLGLADGAAPHPALFAEADRKHRLFRCTGPAGRLPEFPIAGRDDVMPAKRPPAVQPATAELNRLRREAERRILALHAPRYVLIDSEYEILDASAGTGDFLEFPAGRPRANLAAMARGGLAVDIRAAVAQTISSGKTTTRAGIPVGSGQQRKTVTVVVEPMDRSKRPDRLFLVVLKETPAPADALHERRSGAGDEVVVRALEQELQATKERLQNATEELETSSEELRASNEELSSVNEELQSANEELETSKEELQSINEELRTVNAELSTRVDELSRANNDLKNLFANTEIAMLFLDAELRIMNFTPPAKPLFRLRDHDIGRPLDELSGRFDRLAIKAAVEAVLKTAKPREQEVSTGDDDARTFLMRTLPYRDERERVLGTVLAFIDITERKRNEEQLSDLVSELNHRVKNSMAAVQGLIRQTVLNAPTAEALAETLQGRIQAMAAAHHIISDAGWQHADLRTLASHVLTPFTASDDGRLTIAGPAVVLQSNAAVTLAVILQELGTNAVKHGAWSVPEGAVAFRWETIHRDGKRLRLIWTEQGGPPATAPEKENFGLTFIRRGTQYDLHGDCTLQFGAEGLRAEFDLPGDKVSVDKVPGETPPAAGG